MTTGWDQATHSTFVTGPCARHRETRRNKKKNKTESPASGNLQSKKRERERQEECPQGTGGKQSRETCSIIPEEIRGCWVLKGGQEFTVPVVGRGGSEEHVWWCGVATRSHVETVGWNPQCEGELSSGWRGFWGAGCPMCQAQTRGVEERASRSGLEEACRQRGWVGRGSLSSPPAPQILDQPRAPRSQEPVP